MKTKKARIEAKFSDVTLVRESAKAYTHAWRIVGTQEFGGRVFGFSDQGFSSSKKLAESAARAAVTWKEKCGCEIDSIEIVSVNVVH